MESLGAGQSAGSHPLLGLERIDDQPAAYLARIGDVFRVFEK
ncbi:hypothetical protein [Streptomyces sp. SP18BB07]|nr:hypothetical protein [Streptomyces sp. SP18BB07]